jgi:hypothetical protein
MGTGDSVTPKLSADLAERAARNVRLLRRLNIVTLCVAVVVWTGLVTIAVIVREVGLLIVPSCVMLAELLLFQTVRTLCDHFDLVRRWSASPAA